jgi:hypothetical protein
MCGTRSMSIRAKRVEANSSALKLLLRLVEGNWDGVGKRRGTFTALLHVACSHAAHQLVLSATNLRQD